MISPCKNQLQSVLARFKVLPAEIPILISTNRIWNPAGFWFAPWHMFFCVYCFLQLVAFCRDWVYAPWVYVPTLNFVSSHNILFHISILFWIQRFVQMQQRQESVWVFFFFVCVCFQSNMLWLLKTTVLLIIMCKLCIVHFVKFNMFVVSGMQFSLSMECNSCCQWNAVLFC